MGAGFNGTVDTASLAAIMQACEDAVFAKDLDGRYTFINDAGARMLGRSPDRIVGLTDFDLFAFPTAEKMHSRDRAIVDADSPHTYEDTGVVGGQTRSYRSTKGPLRDALGVIVGLWGVSRDVTDEQANRLQRQQLALELSMRVRDLNTAEAKLVQSERLAVLGRLAAVVAHEIRNPLGVILNATSIARREITSASQPSVFDIIQEEVGRLNHLVSDLLDFARPVASVLTRKPIGPIVQSAVDRMLGGAVPDGIRLRMVGLDQPANVVVDERLFVRALVNVLDNACHAMEGTGLLSVTITSEGGMVRVCVTDTGEGFSELARESLFEPFFTTKATGTGLGLYVVERILDEHRGFTHVDSSERGASVTLSLPAASDSQRV